jgi:hypothetical protein
LYSFAPPPPPAKPIVDECYYADPVAILKVEGDKGTLLILAIQARDLM